MCPGQVPPAACGPSPGSSGHEQRFLGSSQTHRGSFQCQIFNPARGHELEVIGQLDEWKPHHQTRHFFFFTLSSCLRCLVGATDLPFQNPNNNSLHSCPTPSTKAARTSLGLGHLGNAWKSAVRCRDQQGDPEPTRFSTKCSAITPGEPHLLPEGRSRCTPVSHYVQCVLRDWSIL